MADIKPNDKVVIKSKQLHGNLHTLRDAEVISVSGSIASVIIDGTDCPTSVNVLDLISATKMYGSELFRPNELPVVNAIRRQ